MSFNNLQEEDPPKIRRFYCPSCHYDLGEYLTVLYSSYIHCPVCGYTRVPIQPNYVELDYSDLRYSNVPPSCRKCSNHPSNGGSGICNCILGLQNVT